MMEMANGRLLVDLPLMRERMVDLLVELEAGIALGFEAAAAGQDDDGIRLRRIIIPAAKVGSAVSGSRRRASASR